MGNTDSCFSCKIFVKCFASMLSKKELTELEGNISMEDISEGNVIYTERKSASQFYIIRSGKVKLEYGNYSLRPMIIGMKQEGDYLGLEALFANNKYLVTATSFSDVSYCTIPQSSIEQLVLSNTAICKTMFSNIQRGLEQNLKYTNLMISGSSLGRLAYVLLLLKDSRGTINAPKEEIARMTGFRRETVSRLLAKLKARNILEISHREVKILNQEELEFME
jgi:CRP-like cAMP-binding protein